MKPSEIQVGKTYRNKGKGWSTRKVADRPEPKGNTFGDWGDSTVTRIDKAMGGFSGAQVGAAKSLAYRAIHDGWAKMLESAPHDRHIQVSKHFPHV